MSEYKPIFSGMFDFLPVWYSQHRTDTTHQVNVQYCQWASQLKYLNMQIINKITVWMCFWLEHKNSYMYLSGLLVKFNSLHQDISWSEEAQEVFITWTKYCVSKKETQIDRKTRTWQHYFWFSVSYINI